MTLQRVSISQQIRERLLDRIARGQLQPGDRVVEAEVASEMQASSIPVREAIRELVAMGVLQFAPHRGAWVRQVSLQETIQAFQVRSVLEPLAAESAAPRLCGKCQQLRRVVKRIVEAARKHDFASFQHHNQVFHRAIVEASDNQVLLRVWDSLAFEVRTRFTMDYLTKVDPVAIAREHELVVAALDCGDAEKAAALLQSHSMELVDYLRAQTVQEGDDSSVPRKQPRRSRRS
jgi:DNA-binding GntR family transcriptional regulator